MSSSFSFVNAEQELACEEEGKFELSNFVITKFESNANLFLKQLIECTLGDQGEILSKSNRRTLW